MSTVIPFRRPNPTREQRIDRLCAAIAPRGPQEQFLQAEAVDGSVKLTVGGLEVWVSADEALAFGCDCAVAARDAEEER